MHPCIRPLNLNIVSQDRREKIPPMSNPMNIDSGGQDAAYNTLVHFDTKCIGYNIIQLELQYNNFDTDLKEVQLIRQFRMFRRLPER